MADINIDYDAVIQSANQLRQGRTQLDQKLTALKGMIDNLVATQFKTAVASGKLGDAQTRFTNAARRSIEALDGMGAYLESVKRQHEELDQSTGSVFGNVGPRG